VIHLYTTFILLILIILQILNNNPLDNIQTNTTILEKDEQDELEKPAIEEIEENSVAGEDTTHSICYLVPPPKGMAFFPADGDTIAAVVECTYHQFEQIIVLAEHFEDLGMFDRPNGVAGVSVDDNVKRELLFVALEDGIQDSAEFCPIVCGRIWNESTLVLELEFSKCSLVVDLHRLGALPVCRIVRAISPDFEGLTIAFVRFAWESESIDRPVLRHIKALRSPCVEGEQER
jgi:hypothetical protein